MVEDIQAASAFAAELMPYIMTRPIEATVSDKCISIAAGSVVQFQVSSGLLCSLLPIPNIASPPRRGISGSRTNAQDRCRKLTSDEERSHWLRCT